MSYKSLCVKNILTLLFEFTICSHCAFKGWKIACSHPTLKNLEIDSHALLWMDRTTVPNHAARTFNTVGVAVSEHVRLVRPFTIRNIPTVLSADSPTLL